MSFNFSSATSGDEQEFDSTDTLCSSEHESEIYAIDTMSDDNALTALLAQLLTPVRPKLSILEQQRIWTWSESEERRDAFCAHVNEAGLASREPRPFVLELIQEPALGSAVSIHASNHGQISVRELIPNLFAIFAPAPVG